MSARRVYWTKFTELALSMFPHFTPLWMHLFFKNYLQKNKITTIIYFSFAHPLPHPRYGHRQYLMTILPNSDMETFPFLSNQNSKIHALKAKGTPAKVKRNMTLADFSDTIVKKQNPRKVKIHSMRRTNFKISIVRTEKKVLSSLNSKVLFSDEFKTDYGHFSFPVHFKAPLGLID